MNACFMFLTDSYTDSNSENKYIKRKKNKRLLIYPFML